jgi:tetratricopeptide (TPR) repeat protein
MVQLGRNAPCRCGSGKKYKRCCLARDAAAERETRASEQDEEDCQCDECLTLDEVMGLSDEATSLIDEGRLNEAEAICRKLIEQYPEFLDGPERLGQVYEARGERGAAAEQYRRAAEIAARMKPEWVEEQTPAILLQRARALEIGATAR